MRKRSKVDPQDTGEFVPAARGRQWKPKNAAQSRLWDTITANTVTFVLGPAGTAKTHTSMAWALDAVRRSQYERIVLTRPIVTATEDLGFLPGDITSKISPFHRPQTEIAGKIDKTIPIEMVPLAFLRGVTLEDSICIGDEFQNATANQLRLYLSRLGGGSKMVVCGDTAQSDIHSSGLYAVAKAMIGLEDVGVFEFTDDDIVRHPLIGSMLNRIEGVH